MLQIWSLLKHQRTDLEHRKFCMLVLDSWVPTKHRWAHSAHWHIQWSCHLLWLSPLRACSPWCTALQCSIKLCSHTQSVLVPSPWGLEIKAYLRSYPLPWVMCLQIPQALHAFGPIGKRHMHVVTLNVCYIVYSMHAAQPSCPAGSCQSQQLHRDNLHATMHAMRWP